MTTHQIQTTARCPTCSTPMDGASNADENESSPRPGDFSVCAYCATLLEFVPGPGKSLGLVELPEQRISTLTVGERRALERARVIVLTLPTNRGSPPRGAA